MFGLGLALAVVMDATIIAACSSRPSCASPATPTGGLPGWMRKIHARFGVHDPCRRNELAAPELVSADSR